MSNQKRKWTGWLLGLLVLLLAAAVIGWLAWRYTPGYAYDIVDPFTATPDDCPPDVRFAVIGDYGYAGRNEAAVADLVAGWDVDFVVTTGDNNYADGEATTIDANIGQFYHEYIHPYQGTYGPGAAENRFFPVLGNHDWRAPGAQPYLDYFTLPGNERYYDVERGPVHLFAVDSDPNEPDGRTPQSVQGQWLEAQMTASDAPWKLVVLHHPPYSSSRHGSEEIMRWPYAAWGATAVLAGHDHSYERLQVDDVVYFVNGLGGRSRYRVGRPLPESTVRYNGAYGAMLVNAADTCINFSFIATDGALIDSYTLERVAAARGGAGVE